MNAQLLADLLLEMNILNPNDLKREVRKLGAHVADPRARQWFMRAVTYWLINIDQLLAKPYKAQAEPRAHTSSKYRTYADQAGDLPPSSLIKYGLSPYAEKPKDDTSPYKFKTGLDKTEPGTLWVKPDQAGTSTKTGFGVFTCAKCKGVGTINGAGCAACRGSGLVRQKTSAISTPPLFIEIKRDPKARIPGEGHFPESLRTGVRIAARLLEENPPTDPEGTYTSMLHQPDMEKQLGQNFTPFVPSKALPKKKTMYGDPWPQEQVPSWATDEKKLYHFNPINVRRRELFQRLDGVVNYLNYLHATAQDAKEGQEYTDALTAAKAEGEEVAKGFIADQQKAVEATEKIRTLETTKTEDIDSFRSIMREAQNFTTQVREQPWLFVKDMRVIASLGAYKIIKAQSIPAAMMLASRQPDEASQTLNWPKTDWCTRMEGHARNYIGQEPALYYIDKDGKPYVLIHFASRQCKDVFDKEVTATVAREIAPVCAKSPELRQRLLAWPARAPARASEEVGLAGLAHYVARVKV